MTDIVLGVGTHGEPDVTSGGDRVTTPPAGSEVPLDADSVASEPAQEKIDVYQCASGVYPLETVVANLCTSGAYPFLNAVDMVRAGEGGPRDTGQSSRALLSSCAPGTPCRHVRTW